MKVGTAQAEAFLKAPDEALPDTGVGIEWERTLSPLFIQSPSYGTRASTVVLIGYDNHVTFVERAFQPNSNRKPIFTNRFDFDIA